MILELHRLLAATSLNVVTLHSKSADEIELRFAEKDDEVMLYREGEQWRWWRHVHGLDTYGSPGTLASCVETLASDFAADS